MKKLNVGCGEFYAAGWTNIDKTKNRMVRPDMVADVHDLPDDLTGLDMIYCGHLLEHIEYEQVVPVLKDLRGRLIPGGRFAAVGPDVDRAESMYAAGMLDGKTVREASTGAQRWDGDKHWWDCTEDELVNLITKAGFVDVLPVPIQSRLLDEWPVTARPLWQAAVLAVSP